MAEARAVSSLGGYDDEFVNAVEEDLHCAICQLPLKDPILTQCGHRFCRQCLDEHFRRPVLTDKIAVILALMLMLTQCLARSHWTYVSAVMVPLMLCAYDCAGRKRFQLTGLELNRQPLSCPVDRNNLTRDKEYIFPDKATERKILSFIIRCPSEGCQWTGELRSKDKHLASCPLKVVSCTNKDCHVTLTRNKLQQHVTTTCPWRIIRCPHCNASHPECKTEAHQTECNRFPLNCPQTCGAVIPREEISIHAGNDCPLIIVSCPYVQMGCTKKIQRRELENHLQTAVRLHLDLACVKLNDTQVQLNDTRVQLNDTQVQLNDTQVQLANTREEQEELKAIKEKLEQKFKETSEKLEEKCNVFETMMQCSEEHNYFKWNISGFSEVLRKAKNQEKTVIYSEPFYRYGYRCRLHLFSNGSGPGRNTHLTIGINIMKGEHDDILPWPFHKKVTFTLIDQQEDANDRENIAKCFIEDPEDAGKKKFFAKPVRNENTGFGILTFVSHNKLKERRYKVDDTIIIQTQISPPQ